MKRKIVNVNNKHLANSNGARRISYSDCYEPVTPPDGGWGWIVVLASFLVHVIVDGIMYSNGIFYFEFLKFFQSGKGETAWVMSLVPGFMLIIGPVAGILSDKHGCRITTFVGVVITTTGLVLSMIAPSLYFMYFSFGILSGLGYGLIYLPAVVSVGQYFENKRAFAVGIASCGSGIGAFALNPFTKFLIDYYGWRGAFLIQAGLILNCAVCGCLFRPLKPKTGTKNGLKHSSTKKENFSEKIQDFHTPLRGSKYDQDCSEIDLQLLSPVDEIKSSRAVQNDTHISTSEGMWRDFAEKYVVSNKITTAINNFCDFSRFKDVIFILYVVSNVFASFGIDIPFIFLYDYSVHKGIDENEAKWFGSIVGIASTLGRAFCGVVADHGWVNKLFVYSIALTVIGTATSLCTLCSSYSSFVVFSSVFGLFHGIYIPLMSVVLVDLLGLDMLSNSFGVLLLFKGFACLTCLPSAGWLFDVTGSYTVPFIVAGLTNITSAVIVIAVYFIQRCRKRKNLGVGTAELPMMTSVEI